jgi:hypothetical protein
MICSSVNRVFFISPSPPTRAESGLPTHGLAPLTGEGHMAWSYRTFSQGTPEAD